MVSTLTTAQPGKQNNSNIYKPQALSTRGLINDSIGDMLTRIRNACLAKKSTISLPFTRINQQIVQILEKEGLIQSYQTSLTAEPYAQNIIVRFKYRSKAIYLGFRSGKKKESCITNLKRISKPGLRIYSNAREIPRILGGTGIVILSTPEGLLTDREARLRGIGGELLCSVW
uniref:Small ribosomal subunit protein uS8c n=1 Tax=Chlamydomonas peterfii TaxID=28462 RepID=A0A0S2ICV9_9CHLO|nr:ribosomal protein S8 [Chlamydomonas peterfii]